MKQSNIIFSLKSSNIYQSNCDESRSVIDLEKYLSIYEKDFQSNPDNDYISLFMYDTCPARFTGRENEMDMLNSFVQDKRKTLWWALTGAAGVGKTRLAYEFIVQLRKKGWLACSVNFPQLLDDLSKYYFKWSFNKNIFIVIDYVYVYEASIAKIIETFERLNSCKKVRVLLIEREYVRTSKDGKMIAPWEDFFSDGFNDQSTRLRTQYTNNNLNLNNSHINDQDAKNIVKSYYKNRNKDIDEYKLKFILELAKSKGEITPLLLLLLAEYYCDSNETRLTLNVYDEVVKEIASREMRIMYKTLNISSQLDKGCFNCLMLAATILGDFNINRNKNKFDKLFYPNRENYDKIISIFTGTPLCFYDGNLEAHIRGIRPDLIGERFVLVEFLSYNDSRITEILKVLQDIDSIALMRFLLRFIEDNRSTLESKGKLSIFEQFLPDDRTMVFTVINDEGKSIECEVLFTFESDLTNKNYIVYTDNTIDIDGNTKVYASIYEPKMDSSTLFPIQTDKEWEIIKTILEELKSQIDAGEDLNKIPDIIEKKLSESPIEI